MKKEVLVAVMIGLTMGLLITYGIYRVQTAINQPPITDVLDTATDSAEISAPTVIALHSPDQGAVQTGTGTIITGTTIPESFVVVFVNDKETITTSDKSGNFTHSTDLSSGTNFIKVHVIDENGNTATAERVVVVSDIFERMASASESAEATDSAEIDQEGS